MAKGKIQKPARVYSLTTNGGNAATNQFEIHTDKGRYFQSYGSIIAFVDTTGQVTLTTRWDYSRTTTKYLTQFLNGVYTKEIRERIESGEYIVDEDFYSY